MSSPRPETPLPVSPLLGRNPEFGCSLGRKERVPRLCRRRSFEGEAPGSGLSKAKSQAHRAGEGTTKREKTRVTPRRHGGPARVSGCF
jgi:hypothetical protein